MSLINEEKVEEESEEYSIQFNSGYANYSKQDFKAGVDFAEKELKDIAIEFAKWIVDRSLKCPYIANEYIWTYNNGNVKAPSTEELFTQFIKERNG